MYQILKKHFFLSELGKPFRVHEGDVVSVIKAEYEHDGMIVFLLVKLKG